MLSKKKRVLENKRVVLPLEILTKCLKCLTLGDGAEEHTAC